MAASRSKAKGPREPESKLQTVARPAVWVSPGELDGVEEICAWLGTYGERLRMAKKHEVDVGRTATLV
jgi:hypothetical protein